MLHFLYCGQNKDCGVENFHIRKSIVNYGCNCYPENKARDFLHTQNANLPGYNGDPIDDIDEACLFLAKRFECFEKDIEEKIFQPIGYSCDYTTSYQWHVGQEGEIVCGPPEAPEYDYGDSKKTTSSKCRLSLCTMDREFAFSIYDLIENPVKFEQENGDKYGIYGDQSKCNVQAPELKNITCCGTYPDRVPLKFEEKCCDNIAKLGNCES